MQRADFGHQRKDGGYIGFFSASDFHAPDILPATGKFPRARAVNSPQFLVEDE